MLFLKYLLLNKIEIIFTTFLSIIKFLTTMETENYWHSNELPDSEPKLVPYNYFIINDVVGNGDCFATALLNGLNNTYQFQYSDEDILNIKKHIFWRLVSYVCDIDHDYVVQHINRFADKQELVMLV